MIETEELIRKVPKKGTQNWYNWNQRWSQRGYFGMKGCNYAKTQIGDRPLVRSGIKLRQDNLLYDSNSAELYVAKPRVIEMLRHCDGTRTSEEIKSSFGEEVLEAVTKLGLLM